MEKSPILAYATTSWGSNPFISGFRPALFAAIGIVLSVIAGLVSAWSAYLDRDLYWRLSHGPLPTTMEFMQAEFRSDLITWVNFVVWVLAVTAFILWVHRIYYNLRSFPGTSVRYRPSQAVWRFFVPLLNLARIPQIMHEIWENSSSWDEEGRSPLVTWWWVTYIVPTFFTFCVRWMFNPRRDYSAFMDRIMIETWLSIVVPLWMCVPACLAVLMIRRITIMQATKAREEMMPNPSFQPTVKITRN